MAAKLSYRAWLECPHEDGTSQFYTVSEVLVSPELQARCIDKQELERILRLIELDPRVAKRIRERN